MGCNPSDGFIDGSSTIYCHGDPIIDIRKVSLRPIFESLPNSHKNLTPRQIANRYLDPYFLGRCRYIDHGRELNVDGVDFSIRESVPINSAGLITCATLIDHNAAAVKASELAEMQAQEDMELARQLQQEEDNQSPFPSMARVRPQQFHQVSLADITDIFERLQAQGPSNSGNANGGNNPNNDPFLQFIRQLQMASSQNPRRQRNSGVNPQLIGRLPTMKYVAKHQQQEEEKDGNADTSTSDIADQCRICLEYYKDGDELRFMPCFHRYHKDCIDRWLQMSSKCPICKNSVTQQLRQPQ